MRSLHAAEWFLSLIMPPQRAASTVGDFLETSHRTLTLWRSVFRTFLAIIGQALSNRPLHTAGMIAKIYGRYMKLSLIFGTALLGFILAWAIIRAFIGPTILDWLPMIVEGVISIFIVPVRLGRAILQQHPAQGIVLALLFSSSVILFECALWIWGGTFIAPSKIEMSYSTLVFPLPSLAVLLAAAIVERRKQLSLEVASA